MAAREFIILIIVAIFFLSCHYVRASGDSQKINKNGIQKEERIIGGDLADIKHYPFTALLVKKYDYGIDFRGGASIISKNWAVTAAHCMMYFDEEDITSRISFVRSNTSHWDLNYIEHRIIKFYSHPKFDKDIVDYDVAIVKVKNPFNGKFEKPIPISRKCKFPINSSATVLGWGTINPHEETMVVDDLRYVNVQLRSFKTCKERYSKIDELVTNRMLCALGPGKDACTNDSGGPLVFNNTLIGIVSWGPPDTCADKKLPGGYSRVSLFYKWIHDKIDK